MVSAISCAAVFIIRSATVSPLVVFSILPHEPLQIDPSQFTVYFIFIVTPLKVLITLLWNPQNVVHAPDKYKPT